MKINNFMCPLTKFARKKVRKLDEVKIINRTATLKWRLAFFFTISIKF